MYCRSNTCKVDFLLNLNSTPLFIAQDGGKFKKILKEIRNREY